MAHIIKDTRSEKMDDRAVFVIVSPFDKQICVSHTPQKRVYKMYNDHYNLKNAKTKEVFVRAKEQDQLPPIYILEFGKMSINEAYSRCVAWTKYFIDHGYTQMKPDRLGQDSNDLKVRSAAHYNQIREESIEEVLQPEGGLFPDYGKRKKKNSDADYRVISIRVDDKEHALLKERAQEQGISLGEYCKRMSLDGRIFRLDFNFIDQYLEEFADNKRLLKQILYTLCKTGNYYPADAANIQYIIDQLTELQKKVSNEITDTIHIVRNNLKE